MSEVKPQPSLIKVWHGCKWANVKLCVVLLFLHAMPHEVKRQVYVRKCHSIISAMCRTVKFGYENDLLSKTLKMLKKAEKQLEIKVK